MIRFNLNLIFVSKRQMIHKPKNMIKKLSLKITSVLIALSLVSMACMVNKKTSEAQAAQAVSDQYDYISMRRSACFGTCPVYTIHVEGNGLVTYSGEKFTEYEGIYEKQFETKQMNEFFAQVQALKLDTCQTRYKTLITDLPGIHFEVKLKNRDTAFRIDRAEFGPMFLKNLAMNMDELFKIDDSWKRMESQPD